MQTPPTQNPNDRTVEHEESSGMALVRRVYLPRVFGVALGALCIGVAMLQHGAGPIAWLLLVAYALAWPHLAYRWAGSAASPRAGEERNLLVDAGCGGIWIIAIGGNLLPSVLVLKLIATGLLAVGGWRLALRGSIALVGGAVVGSLLLGLRFEPRSELMVVVAAIPVLLASPLMFGLTTYRLFHELKRQKEVLRTLHEHDSLSGLRSRASMDDRLQQEFERFRRYGRPVTLVLLDIDHFKSVNDSFGHPAGDEVIRSIGELLRTRVRSGDMVARYGGEEFAAILPETRAKEAFILADRLRRTIEGLPIVAGGHTIRLTVSGGIASLPPRAATTLLWIERADRALYRAKREGRNRILLDEEGSGEGESRPAVATASATRDKPTLERRSERIKGLGGPEGSRSGFAGGAPPPTAQACSGRSPG